MAGEFLKSHGIDIDSEMARVQGGGIPKPSIGTSIQCFRNVSLPKTDRGTAWDVFIKDGLIDRISESSSKDVEQFGSMINGGGALLAPSLCHPHIHIDKAYLLSHPKYAHLQIESGDFKEAMSLTNRAKSRFERDDLIERGQRLVDESVAAGVTHMRAFVEVDAGVGIKCLEAGIALKRKAAFQKTCHIQLCAFAQLPLFSATEDDHDGSVIRELMRQAAINPEVDVLGSTPYVESDRAKMEENANWIIDLCMQFDKHLDLHLDYNLDSKTEASVWQVVHALREKDWNGNTTQKTVVLGHCTRLSLFGDTEWQSLATEIEEAGLPISFVGLPASDLFMMRTGHRPEVRGTLDIPRYIKDWSLNACIGINNIGNAFTPQGSCDPLSLACQGVGLYQAGTKEDAVLLFECVSVRARAAIGCGSADDALEVQPGNPADLVLFASDSNHDWRTRRSISDAVYLYDRCHGRRSVLAGNVTTSTF